MNKMKQFGIKSAWTLAAGAIFALSVTILNSCSSDEDYDMYMGDELRTHAAATRSAAPEPGMSGSDSEDNKSYVYTFVKGGPREVTECISLTENFYVTVEFDWIAGGEAKSTQISASSVEHIPVTYVWTKGGNYIERPKYKIVSKSCSKVIPTIWDGNKSSKLVTSLVVVYQLIYYTTKGNEYGYGSSQTYSNEVQVDVTDCVEEKVYTKQ